MDLFKILNSSAVFVEEVSNMLKEAVIPFVESFNQWKEKETIRVTDMVKIGWYPNWATISFDHKEDACKNYDEFMIQRLDENFDNIVEKILSVCMNRTEILQNAFDLYKVENYIACIPLFLSQADGISNEEYGYFFTQKERGKGKAPKIIIENHENDKYDLFTEIVIELFKMHMRKTTEIQLISPIANDTISNKMNGLNRNGILHGDQEHLDYGTKINAYKAFSFLAFIVFSVKDILREKKPNLSN